MNVRAVLRECASDLLDTEPSVTVQQVVACAYRRHGDVFTEATEQMVLASARDIVAALMRDLSSDDEEPQQLALEGLALPSAIAVQSPDGTYYVRSDKATWPELMAGRAIREQNVTAAQRKLYAYDESCETLRPFMEGSDRTVAEAARLMGGEAA